MRRLIKNRWIKFDPKKVSLLFLMNEDNLVRFMKYVVKTDSCWLWKGSKNSNGYGKFGFQGKVWYAHRLIYLHCHGELINDLDICHICRSKCVNPDHLEQKSHSENNGDDKIRDGTDNSGEKNGLSKLTNAQVLDIRSRTNQTQQSIADDFGVSLTTINNILKRNTWTHI
jgi:hypothetical protein